METNQKEKCPKRNPLTSSQCQLDKDHNGECVFPIDDAFFDALDDGRLIIGRPPRKQKWYNKLLDVLVMWPIIIIGITYEKLYNLFKGNK